RRVLFFSHAAPDWRWARRLFEPADMGGRTPSVARPPTSPCTTRASSGEYGDPQSGGGTTGRHRANDGRRRANEAFGGQVTLPAHSPGRSRPLSGSVRTGVRPDADYPCPRASACRGGGAPAPAHCPRDAPAGNSAAGVLPRALRPDADPPPA